MLPLRSDQQGWPHFGAASPDLVNIQPPIPSVYFEVGGTPPEQLAAGTWAETHSPLFKIDPEATIKSAVEAMTLAAVELLAKP